MSGGWVGSTRRKRLPGNWAALRKAADRRNPRRVCHVCGAPGGDRLDHIEAGDVNRPENLDWIHDDTPPHCHRYKSSAEGNAARWAGPSQRRPPEPHPALG
jgi:5-methylcytosine-specific restriction protein A